MRPGLMFASTVTAGSGRATHILTTWLALLREPNTGMRSKLEDDMMTLSSAIREAWKRLPSAAESKKKEDGHELFLPWIGVRPDVHLSTRGFTTVRLMEGIGNKKSVWASSGMAYDVYWVDDIDVSTCVCIVLNTALSGIEDDKLPMFFHAVRVSASLSPTAPTAETKADETISVHTQTIELCSKCSFEATIPFENSIPAGSMAILRIGFLHGAEDTTS